MAVLSDQDRRDLWADFMRDSANIQGLAITKAELRAAFDAADVWADTNAAAFNSAIPQPARGAMNAKQKTLMLAWVILRRANIL